MKGPMSHQELAALHDRIARHLLHLSFQVQDTENVLSKRAHAVQPVDDEYLTGMQTLDYLHQSLVDMATLIASMSIHPVQSEALMDKVRLESTRAIVADRTVPVSAERVSAGALDLF